MDRYSDFFISRKQAQQICFAILADIEAYCKAHQSEFDEFLKNEERGQRDKKLESGNISDILIKI